MKKIVYFYYPTESGGVIFQNGYLDEGLRNNPRLYETSRSSGCYLYSQSVPEVGSNVLYLQGDSRRRDLDFEIKKREPSYLKEIIKVINKINNGDINV